MDQISVGIRATSSSHSLLHQIRPAYSVLALLQEGPTSSGGAFLFGRHIADAGADIVLPGTRDTELGVFHQFHPL